MGNKKCLIPLLLFGLLVNGNTQIYFDSESLKNLYDQLTEAEKASVLEVRELNQHIQLDTVIPVSWYSLSVSFDDYRLKHLGIRIRNLPALHSYDSLVLVFLERALLRLSYDKTIQDIVSTAELIQVRILVQDNELLFSPIQSYQELVNQINTANQFTLSRDNYHYAAAWKGDDQSITFLFPVNYQLLTGKNKKELDEELFRKLGELSLDHRDKTLPETTQTSIDSLPVLVSKGSRYMEHLSSDSYFKWDGKDSVLVFEEDQIQYSVSNLFLHENLAGNRTLQLTQQLYGGRSVSFKLLLWSLIQHMNTDFQAFIGLENDTPDLVEGIVIFSHTHFNYVNMLHFRADVSNIFSNNGNINADLYANIPIHNLKNLMKEYHPGNTEGIFELNIKEP